jgi:hypothetical protein
MIDLVTGIVMFALFWPIFLLTLITLALFCGR